MSIEILDDIIRLKQEGIARGLPSICSAHPFVLKVVMERAAANRCSRIGGVDL